MLMPLRATMAGSQEMLRQDCLRVLSTALATVSGGELRSARTLLHRERKVNSKGSLSVTISFPYSLTPAWS